MSARSTLEPTTARVRQRRATVGAFIGTAIEWYDFYIFGTAAALVFGRVFYPEIDPAAALVASFATFWVGFLARPIGGVIFGHFGDRFGRKNTLVVTLVMMGAATTAIGLLPTYAQIGIAAPLFLVVLRAIQGAAVGGEWGGAVLLATENASEKRKGFAGSWVQQGSPAGSILATIVFLAVGTLPEEQFISWGWRVPFLLSAVLVVIGLVIRLKVEESADFVHTKEIGVVVKAPALEVFRRAPLIVVLGIAASVTAISQAYFTNTFLLAWTTGPLEIDRQLMLSVLLGVSVMQLTWQPFAALIAERLGAQKVMLGGLTIALIAVVPFYLAILSGSIPLISVMLAVSIFGGSTYYALLANTLASAFPANIRYTGVSLSYQLCSSLVGGVTPLLAQWILTASGGSPWGLAIFNAVVFLVTMYGVWRLHQIARPSEAPMGGVK